MRRYSINHIIHLTMAQRERVRRYATKAAHCAKHTGELLFYGSALVLLACLCPWLLCMKSDTPRYGDFATGPLPKPRPLPLRRIHLSRYDLRDAEGSERERAVNENLKAITAKNSIESRLLRLPPELRRMIWKFAVGREKRHILIQATGKEKKDVKIRGKFRKRTEIVYGMRSTACKHWNGLRDTRQSYRSPDGCQFNHEVHLLQHTSCCIFPYPDIMRHDGLSLAMTCRTAYRESIDLLYRQTIFEFGNPAALGCFIRSIPQDRARWVRNVEVYWDTKNLLSEESETDPWYAFSETVKSHLRLDRLNLNMRVEIGDNLPPLTGVEARWLQPLLRLSDGGRGVKELAIYLQIEAFEEYTRTWGCKESNRFKRELAEKMLIPSRPNTRKLVLDEAGPPSTVISSAASTTSTDSSWDESIDEVVVFHHPGLLTTAPPAYESLTWLAGPPPVLGPPTLPEQLTPPSNASATIDEPPHTITVTDASEPDPVAAVFAPGRRSSSQPCQPDQISPMPDAVVETSQQEIPTQSPAPMPPIDCHCVGYVHTPSIASD